jgi:hypothetical protein
MSRFVWLTFASSGIETHQIQMMGMTFTSAAEDWYPEGWATVSGDNWYNFFITWIFSGFCVWHQGQETDSLR